MSRCIVNAYMECLLNSINLFKTSLERNSGADLRFHYLNHLYHLRVVSDLIFFVTTELLLYYSWKTSEFTVCSIFNIFCVVSPFCYNSLQFYYNEELFWWQLIFLLICTYMFWFHNSKVSNKSKLGKSASSQ